MGIELEGLCRECINDKCRKWLVRNLDGVEGVLTVSKCEFFTPEKEAG